MNKELSLKMVEPEPLKPQRKSVGTIVFLSLFLLCLAGSAAWLLWGRTPLQHGSVFSTLQPVIVPINAKIMELFVRDGDKITAGQPVARLDVSAYSRYEDEARALVRASLAAQAQRADAQQTAYLRSQENSLVQRLAEARYAEEDARQILEQNSILLARATLHRREMDMDQSPSAAGKRQAAQQAEKQAQQAKQTAKLNFERLNNSRRLVEKEIRRMRETYNARVTAPPVMPRNAAQDTGIDPLVRAPAQGIVQGLLQPGHSLGRDGIIMYIAPEVPWKVIAMLPTKQAQQLKSGQICSVTLPAPHNTTEWGIIAPEKAPPAAAGTTPVAKDGPYTTANALNDGSPNGNDMENMGTGTRPVTIFMRTGANLKIEHGLPVQITVWRNTLPGLKKIFTLLTPQQKPQPKAS